MPSATLPYSREGTRTLVKLAFEYTKGIKTYNDDDFRIVGKTGIRFVSWGEKIIVEIPLNQKLESETKISVHSEKSVDINITAAPEIFEQRFIAEVNSLAGEDIDSIEMAYSGKIKDGTSQQSANSTPAVWLTFAIILFGLLFIILIAGP